MNAPRVCLAFVALFLVCAPALGQDQTPPMKGMELYSWPTSRGWRFSLLPGTNRLKTQVEVTQNPLFGVAKLLEKLETLPKGSEVLWLGKKTLEARWGMGGTAFDYPPRSVREQVRAACAKRGLALSGLPGRRSVIYFIGDGMGVAQVTLGRMGAAAAQQPYHLDRFKSIGLSSTRSSR